MKPLTRKEMDTARCAHPGCTSCGPLVLRSWCHPRAGSRVRYHAGELQVSCDVCGKLVAKIAVAEGKEPS